jgi:hypothetical protein
VGDWRSTGRTHSRRISAPKKRDAFSFVTPLRNSLDFRTPCFADAVATIRKREGEWVLESAQA